jgi:hypothetical protein
MREEDIELLYDYLDDPSLTMNAEHKYYGVKQNQDYGLDYYEPFKGVKIDKAYIKRLETMLKEYLPDLVHFCNFTENNQIRILEKYSPLYTGVSYLTLDELRNLEVVS